MLLVQSTKPIAGTAQTVISATKHLSIQSPVTLATRAQKNQKKNTLVTLVSIALKGATIDCPAGYYCPTYRTFEYQKCGNGTYCPPKSSAPLNCPAGSFGTGRTDNYDFSTSCVSCGRGQYSA